MNLRLDMSAAEYLSDMSSVYILDEFLSRTYSESSGSSTSSDLSYVSTPSPILQPLQTIPSTLAPDTQNSYDNASLTADLNTPSLLKSRPQVDVSSNCENVTSGDSGIQKREACWIQPTQQVDLSIPFFESFRHPSAVSKEEFYDARLRREFAILARQKADSLRLRNERTAQDIQRPLNLTMEESLLINSGRMQQPPSAPKQQSSTRRALREDLPDWSYEFDNLDSQLICCDGPSKLVDIEFGPIESSKRDEFNPYANQDTVVSQGSSSCRHNLRARNDFPLLTASASLPIRRQPMTTGRNDYSLFQGYTPQSTALTSPTATPDMVQPGRGVIDYILAERKQAQLRIEREATLTQVHHIRTPHANSFDERGLGSEHGHPVQQADGFELDLSATMNSAIRTPSPSPTTASTLVPTIPTNSNTPDHSHFAQAHSPDSGTNGSSVVSPTPVLTDMVEYGMTETPLMAGASPIAGPSSLQIQPPVNKKRKRATSEDDKVTKAKKVRTTYKRQPKRYLHEGMPSSVRCNLFGCGLSLAFDKEVLEPHFCDHYKWTTGPFVCAWQEDGDSSCENSYDSLKGLWRHFGSAHTDILNTVCRLCHAVIVRGDEGRHVCTFCSVCETKVGTGKKAMEEHRLTCKK